MAIPSRSQNSCYFSLKLLLFSTAILTAALFLKLSIPVAVSALPVLWKTAVLWLTPPYLYAVLNFIIITIAASSRYQHKQMSGGQGQGQGHAVEVPMKLQVDPRSDYGLSTDLRSEYGSMLGFDAVLMKSPSPSPVSDVRSDFEVLERNVVGSPVKEVEVKSFPVVASDRECDDFVIKRSALAPVLREAKEIWVPASTTESSVLTEKPPATVRFAHRRSSKASPDGSRTLGVSKPKRHDTLESTWKTITDGRSIPLARHLKKSETFETHGRHAQESSTDASKMKKSETFNERHSGNSSLSPSPGSGKLRKEPSLSQDELNRRVEAFIKKFNEEMRLQRQESLNQYKQMVQRH